MANVLPAAPLGTTHQMSPDYAADPFDVVACATGDRLVQQQRRGVGIAGEVDVTD